MSDKSRQQAIADAGATIVAELTAIRKELEAIRALLARQAGKAAIITPKPDSKAAPEDYWRGKDTGLAREESALLYPESVEADSEADASEPDVPK